MAIVDKSGMLTDSRIMPRRFLGIEHGPIAQVNAIVVHQTDSPSEQAAFNAYGKGGNGAHILIGKSGITYQTASINSKCWHVGHLIRSRCLSLGREHCSDPAYAALAAASWKAQVALIDTHERTKRYPERYPVNDDALGIELVGQSEGPKQYEAVTEQQNTALRHVIAVLAAYLQLGTEDDVFRHPDVSYKNAGEAAGAKWK